MDSSPSMLAGLGLPMLVGLLVLFGMALCYVYALMFGPAMRYLGRKWEEGRQDAIDRKTWREGKTRLADYQRTKPAGETLSKEQLSAVERGEVVARDTLPAATSQTPASILGLSLPTEPGKYKLEGSRYVKVE